MAVSRSGRADADERALVADMADTMQLHGYKVTRHTVSHDHERDETRLSVSFVKASDGEKQGVLKMAPAADVGEGDAT